MKKLIEKLENNGIKYEVNRYGNGSYFNDNFSVSGVSILVWNYGIENNDKTVVNYFLHDIKRNKKYTVINSGGYGVESYRIFLCSDYEKLVQHEKEVKRVADTFWSIKSKHGKIQADAYYYNEVRKHNLQVAI